MYKIGQKVILQRDSGVGSRTWSCGEVPIGTIGTIVSLEKNDYLPYQVVGVIWNGFDQPPGCGWRIQAGYLDPIFADQIAEIMFKMGYDI